jgi:hypothetical protein
MKNRILAAVVLMLALLLVLPKPAAQSEPMLQIPAPTLDGINIYFTESSGEASRFDRGDPGLSRFAGLLSQLGANLFTLEWRNGFPTDADMVVVAGPTTDLTPDQTARLWAYVANGGHLLLLAQPAPELPRAVLPVNSPLFALMWNDLGLRALNQIIVTPNAEPSPQPEFSGEGPTPVPIRDGLFTTFNAASIAEHPVTAGVNPAGLTFFGARPLEIDAAIQGFTNTPLAFTADTYYGESAYTEYITTGVVDYNIGQDTPYSNIPVIAAHQNDTTGTRLLLVGDRDIATNGKGFNVSPAGSAGFLYPDNVRLMINAVSWLLNVPTTEFSFPTPAATATVTITPSPTLSPTPTVQATPTSSS